MHCLEKHVPDAVLANKHIIVFDGICNLCHWWVIFVIQRDKTSRFVFASVQSVSGKSILEWLGQSPDDVKTMVYVAEKQPSIESMAFLNIVRQLPWPWSWISALKYCPAFIRDGVYRIVARNRYAIFGKKDACMIPNASISQRFLD